MRSDFEVADVLQRLGSQREQMGLNTHQLRTLRAIEMCRTPMLGGHVDACDTCGHISISYNSCRNRHCPKCQGHEREEWIQKREQDLLPCTYYHVVFTLPQQLNSLALHRPGLVYDALFKSVWQTIRQFGKTAGVNLGMIAVLHTWGQNLSLHPHLHCIIPGGGIDKNGKWQKQVRSNKYLFPVKALSKVFRAKYVQHLRENGIENKALLESLFQQDWVVYAKRPFGGPVQVIEYLGRYTHKVAISNHRLKEVTDTDVSFTYKDYRESGKNKTMSLTHREFIRRFAQHILPLRFVRIRHYGILSSTWKRGKLQALQSELKVKRPEAKTKTLLRKCPCCKTGTLITIEVFGKRGPPKEFLMENQPVPVPLS
jgi:hypothetical protein